MKIASLHPACDVAGWIGQYPFRGILNSTIDDLQRKMNALAIHHVIVSPYESIFWENNFDAFVKWNELLQGIAGLELWPVVNPCYPDQLYALERLFNRHKPRGIRLMPGYHPWHIDEDNARLDRLMQMADRYDLIVQVVQRIADERWHYMLHTPAASDEALQLFAKRYAGQPVLISGSENLLAWASLLHQQDNLYIDLSRTRGPMWVIEKLVKKVPIDRLVLGTLWPHQMIEPTLWQVYDAAITAKQRKAILWDNAWRMLNPTLISDRPTANPTESHCPAYQAAGATHDPDDRPPAATHAGQPDIKTH